MVFFSHFFSPILPNSGGLNLSPMELRISGVNQKPESARLYNLRIGGGGGKKKFNFSKEPPGGESARGNPAPER